MDDSQISWTRLARACAVASAWMFPCVALAIAPPNVTDQELARYPIVVIGKWNEAPFRTHANIDGNHLKACEGHTELVVERVIHGDLKPGTHKILVGFQIGWEKNGAGLMSYTSTQVLGDVETVIDPNLWFLAPGRSWDRTDPEIYPKLNTYRGVQPLALEAYFRALATSSPELHIPRLLAENKPVVQHRVLRFACGGELPWPYEPDEFDRFLGIDGTGKRSPQFAGDVAKLFDQKDPQIRREAAAVYAELAGAESTPRLRQLLDDPDAGLRAIAAGALVQQDDAPPAESICRALVGLDDGHLGCRLVESLRKWKDLSAVSALIELLQNDTFSYRIGDDFGVPALKAQEALRELTGVDFPTDVETARRSWSEAKTLADAGERKARLASLLAYEARPLKGKIVAGELVLINSSKQVLTISKLPTDISYEWSSAGSTGVGSLGRHTNEIIKGDFASLAPGETLHVKLELDSDRLPRVTRMSVTFLRNGNEFGLNAWLGTVVTRVEPK